MLLSCSTVELTLAVVNSEVAPEGTVSFDVTKPARRQFDPFACPVDIDVPHGALSQEASFAVVRRYASKVAVRRIVADSRRGGAVATGSRTPNRWKWVVWSA